MKEEIINNRFVDKLRKTMEIDNLTVIEKASGKTCTFSRSNNDFYNVKDGGKRWE